MFEYILACYFAVYSPAAKAKDAEEVLECLDIMSSRSWKERDKVFRYLNKMLSEDRVSLGFMNQVFKGKILKKNKPYELEVRRRCELLVEKEVWVTSDSEEYPYPGIWHLSNELRFPIGFIEINKKHWWLVKKIADQDPFFGLDLSALYYVKAKNEYNNFLRSMVDEFGVAGYNDVVGDEVWRHHEIEARATQMLVRDLRLGGMRKCEVKSLLNKMVEWRTTLQYHYNYYYSEYDDSDKSKPGPSVEVEKDDR